MAIPSFKAMDNERIHKIVQDLADKLEMDAPLTFLNRTAVSSPVMTSATVPSIDPSKHYFVADAVFEENSEVIDTTVLDWLDDFYGG